MKISAIILTMNGEVWLSRCLDAIYRSGYPQLEVIVVDNGSPDKTSATIQNKYPDVKYVKLKKNLGCAGGCNKGIEVATGDVIIIFDNDTIVYPDYFLKIIDAINKYPAAGIFGCKLLYPDRKTIQHAGAIINANGLTEHIGNNEEDKGQYEEAKICDYVTGAAYAIKKEVIDTIGKFDACYFPGYFEEVDYCLRARRYGFKSIYIPAAQVIHYESSTFGKNSFRYYYFYHKNRLRFIIKNFTWSQLFKALKFEIKWLLKPYNVHLYPALLIAYLVIASKLPFILWARRKACPITIGER